MTKRIGKTIGLGAAVVMMAAGCTREYPTSPIESDAIGFAPSVVRSAVSSLGNGDSFAVWARESKDGVAQMILSQEEIHCEDGVWRYDDLRYWQWAAVYDFYALYPHDVPNAGLQGAEELSFVVRDFDARNSEDLMVAEQTGLRYAGNPAPVVFSFQHLLSKVEFVGRIDPSLTGAGLSARLLSAELYGMPATGSCTIDAGTDGTWIFGENTTGESPFCAVGTKELSFEGVSIFGELLLFPQAVGQEWILELEYEYVDADYSQNRFTKIVRLADAGVSEWKPGLGYRYSFSVGRDYILFDKPEVVPWKSASGGIITVE